MTFANLAKRAQKFTIDNSPFILTAIGVTGTVATAYLTGRASFKASKILLESSLALNSEEMTKAVTYPDFEASLQTLELKDAVNLTWKLYIPAVFSGAATIAAIVGANQIGTRRTAALAAAFSLSQTAVEEYKTKVLEKLGDKKAAQIQDEMAQDRVNANPASGREVIITGTDEVLCCELFTMRYFKSSAEQIKKAQNDLNYRLLHDSYASLSDFYDLLGLPRTSTSDEIGWTSEKQLEIRFSTTLSDDSKPCIAIDYQVMPVRDYFRFH